MNKLYCIAMMILTSVWAYSQTPGNDLQMRQGGQVRFGAEGVCNDSNPGAAVKLSVTDGLEQHAIQASDSGAFSFLSGTFRVRPEFENPEYFAVSPAEANVSFGAAGESPVFCIRPNGTHRDAEVLIIPDNLAADGGMSTFNILVRNKGNQPINGVVAFQFPDEAVFNQAFPSPDSQGEKTIYWAYNDLQPLATATFTAKLSIQQSDIDPGEIAFSANLISSDSDETPANNLADIKLPMTPASPNNKICLEGEVAPVEMIGQYLNYVINFKNTTNATVQKIVVYDEIDTNKFEMASLQVLGLSHPGIPVVLNNKFEVYFQNIALPPGGQGWVGFRIKTKPTLLPGSTVLNKAKLYFDFNAPIETTIASTTFELLSVGDHQMPTVKIYPNPASGQVNFEANQEIVSMVVTDAQGRIVAQSKGEGNIMTCDVSRYTSGLYCVKIVTVGGAITRKLIVQ